MRIRRWPLATGIVLVTALLVTGCGGGDDGDDSRGAASSSTTSTSLAADAASTKLAEDAQLTAADLGAGWTEYQAAEEPEPYTDRCADLRAHAVHLPGGTKTKGAILQLGGNPAFVQSDVLVFEDEASAQEYVEDRLSQEYLECFRGVLDKEQRGRDENLQVSIADEEEPNVGTGGLEGTTRYVVTDADGNEMAHLYRSVWRYGRVVIMVGIDIGQSNDPSLATAAGEATATALANVQARVAQQ
jgi:hypothetical protein